MQDQPLEWIKTLPHSSSKHFPGKNQGANDAEFIFKSTQQKAFSPQENIAKIGRIKGAYDPDTNRGLPTGSNIHNPCDFKETRQRKLFVHKGLGLFETLAQKNIIEKIIETWGEGSAFKSRREHH